MLRPRVEIDGMKELRAKLRELGGKDLVRELRMANLRVAEYLADQVRQDVPSRTGTARASVRAKGEQLYAVLQGGGRKARYYPWLDFGGRVGRQRSVERTFLKSGRYIYPNVAKHHERIIDEYTRELTSIIESTGLEVE